MKKFIQPKFILALSLLFISQQFFACDKKREKKPSETKVTPAESLAATRAMVDWLECEECEEGQLESVIQQGKLLRPLLISALKSGAAPASRELYRYELEKRYDELTAYGQTHPGSKPTLPKPDFVELYLGKYDALYKVRAAQALGKIGGEGVKEALNKAANAGNTKEVREAILKVRDEIK